MCGSSSLRNDRRALRTLAEDRLDTGNAFDNRMLKFELKNSTRWYHWVVLIHIFEKEIKVKCYEN